jgi:class 3 adenylate cyclase
MGEPGNRLVSMADESEGKPAKRFVDSARRLNRKPSLLRSVRDARERLLGGDEHVDRLSTARGRPSDLAVKQLAELRSERPGVLGELGLTALQAWQRLAESQDRGRGKVDVAILFTDLVGFSSWALGAGDAAVLSLLREVGVVVEAAVVEHDGRIVKRLGDGLMATFLSVQDALEAALDAQDALGGVVVDGYRPRMRAGVHWGRPRPLGGDYLGVDVNIAARVADAAKADQVLVSEGALSRVDLDALTVGRSKRLKAQGAPRGLRVVEVSR